MDIYIYIYTQIYTYIDINIYIYIYVNTHTYRHTDRQTDRQIYIHTDIHTYIRTSIHTYGHPYIHTYIQTYIHTYLFARRATCADAEGGVQSDGVGKYIHTYIHTYVRTYIHTYIRLLHLLNLHTHYMWNCPRPHKKRPPFPPPNHPGELEGAIDLDEAEVVLGALLYLEVVLEASVSVAEDGELGSP